MDRTGIKGYGNSEVTSEMLVAPVSCTHGTTQSSTAEVKKNVEKWANLQKQQKNHCPE